MTLREFPATLNTAAGHNATGADDQSRRHDSTGSASTRSVDTVRGPASTPSKRLPGYVWRVSNAVRPRESSLYRCNCAVKKLPEWARYQSATRGNDSVSGKRRPRDTCTGAMEIAGFHADLLLIPVPNGKTPMYHPARPPRDRSSTKHGRIPGFVMSQRSLAI